MDITIPKTEIFRLHFCRRYPNHGRCFHYLFSAEDTMVLMPLRLFTFVRTYLALQATTLGEWREIAAVTQFLTHSRSLKYSGTNQKLVCDFLLVNNSNLHPISYCFKDIAEYWSEFRCLTHSFGVNPSNQNCDIWHQETRDIVLWCGAKYILISWTVCVWLTIVTDRRTDKQTDGLFVENAAVLRDQWRRNVKTGEQRGIGVSVYEANSWFLVE